MTVADGKVIEMTPPRVGIGKPGTRAVVAPKESLIYQNCEQERARFDEFLKQNKIEILLDLKSVPYIDSAGLDLLLSIHEELRGRGGMLKLFGVNPVCKDIFLATRLINMLHIYDDIHSAMRGVS